MATLPTARPTLAFSARLAWSGVPEATGYKVYVRQSNQPYGAGTDVGSLTADADGLVAYVISGLPTNVSNFFAVTSYNATRSESGLSNELSLMVTATPNPPATPTPPSVSPVASTPTATQTAPPPASQTPTATFPPNAVRTPGLIAAYSFDEAAGETVYDSSGTGNNGTFGVPVTRTTDSKYGSGALSFPGTAGSYVTVPHSASLEVPSAITLEAWVYPTVLDGNLRLILAKEMRTPSNDSAWAFYGPGWDGANKPAGLLFDNDTNTWFACRGNTDLSPNLWNHVAITYDRATGKQIVYVNGSVDRTCFQGSHNIKVSDRPLRIGGISLWNAYFIGRIDEVRIWNYARSAAEVQSDRDTPVGTPPSSVTHTATATRTATHTAPPTATA
ncbi:MAG: LamG domain-containing protein, partial [Candidatus Binatia bacterium]